MCQRLCVKYLNFGDSVHLSANQDKIFGCGKADSLYNYLI
jgi:hypothetical protein